MSPLESKMLFQAIERELQLVKFIADKYKAQ